MSRAKSAVRRYFDDEVEGYLDAYHTERSDDSRHDVFIERRDLVLELMPAGAGRVLDIGAGPGVFTTRVLDRGARCWVVDLSYEMVATARREVGPERKGACFLVGDLDGLPFGNERFDAAICVGVLQYLPSLEFAFSELGRVVQPGGVLILTFPNSRSPLNILHRIAIAAARGVRSLAERLRLVSAVDSSRLTFRPDIPNQWFSAAEIERLSSTHGFEPDEAIYHVLHFPFTVPGLGWLIRGWNRLVRGRRLSGMAASWGREGIVRLKRVR